MPDILEMLMQSSGRSGPDRPRPEVLETFKKYLFAAQQYNAAGRRVAEIFGLTQLEDASFWAHVISEGPPEMIHKIFRSVHYAVDFLPALGELVLPDSSNDALSKEQAATGQGSNPVLTLILPEGEHQHSRPLRISEALMGITHLYEAVATVESVAENTLIVLTCDSGSDKSFDLFGAAKVIAGVKEIILSLWDRIVFYREAQMAHRLELITASLPILEKVSHLQSNNTIAPEQAELLRRKVLDGVGQFIASGATIPEMGRRSHVDPRQLMAPEPKLLTSGIEDPQSKAKPSPGRGKRKPPQSKT
jgi:hypothetical protein